MSHAVHHPEDKGAAFTGLIAGLVFVGAVMLGITLWTNAKFEGHKAEKAAAEAPAP
jgi:hypothetical protein